MTHRHANTASFWGATLVSLAGPLIWSLHFGAVYLVQHVACATDGGEIAGVLLAATIIALAALALFAWTPAVLFRFACARQIGEETRQFLTAVTRALLVLSFVGVAWTGAALIFLPECAVLR